MNSVDDENHIFRIIDANLNRLREGIRVIEDIQRYAFDNKELSFRLKNLRHEIKIGFDVLTSRDIKNDVLKKSTESENKRDNLESVIKANIKRTQESSRVLEEVFKIIDIKIAEKFKNIRHELYDIEKYL